MELFSIRIQRTFQLVSTVSKSFLYFSPQYPRYSEGFVMSFMAFMDLEFIASVEKMNCFQFSFHGRLFRIRHILERCPVFT